MKRANKKMIAVNDALESVLTGVSKLGNENISLSNGLGRILATDLNSRVTQPPTAVSSMDGFAVSADDIKNPPTSLTQIGISAAGHGFDGKIKKGETVRIFTGAPVPQGTNAIVIQENVEVEDDRIIVKSEVTEGKYIRRTGLDFKSGDKLLKKGTKLNYRNLALAAAMNQPWLNVVRKPNIAILSTGDELVSPGELIKPGQIISSNNLGISAMISANGGSAINLGIAKDNANSIKEMISELTGVDMLVTIGGASVGDFDLIKSVLGDVGLDITFSKVAMRPGKPLIFGKFSGIPMLGLPGNPVSAGVTAALFLRPAINKMLGKKDTSHETVTALSGSDLAKNDERQDYLRATLSTSDSGGIVATAFLKQDSSMLATYAKADCLIVRHPYAEELAAGQPVNIIRLDELS